MSSIRAFGVLSRVVVASVGDHYGSGSAQPAWTGYEAVVFGGIVGSTVRVFDGATYQPPVGCVCPSSGTEACAGISSAATVCAP